MNFGYLIIVSTDSDYDYLRMAYALAISIKNTQKPGYDRVALVIDNEDKLSDLNSPWVFDDVRSWDRENFWNGRSWMDQLSPWDATICLDADMIFTRDISHWVDYFLENCELYVANKAYTYRSELVTSDFYRKAFTENSLPNLYSYFTFFKKDSDISKDFFELGRFIIKNPDEFSNLFLSEYKPKIMGTDEAFALASKILGLEDQISFPLDFPKVMHMKPMVQNWSWSANKVTDYVGFYVNYVSEIKVGNYLQNDIIHYVEKDKITEEVISIFENKLWKKT